MMHPTKSSNTGQCSGTRGAPEFPQKATKETKRKALVSGKTWLRIRISRHAAGDCVHWQPRMAAFTAQVVHGPTSTR